MSDVGDKQESNPFQRTDFVIQGDTHVTQNAWKASLLESICRANFCVSVRLQTPKGNKYQQVPNATVVGRSVNVVVVIGLFQYLEAEARRLEKNAWRIQKDSFHGARFLFAKSWFAGFCNTVNVRLQAEQRQSVRDNGERGSALVVQSEKEVKLALDGFFGANNLKDSRRRASRVATVAYEAGSAAGRNVNLNKQIASNTGLMRLGK